MTAVLLEGAAIAAGLRGRLMPDLDALRARGVRPKVVAINNVDNAAARVYLRMQQGLCEESGVAFELREIHRNSTEAEILAHLKVLNEDPKVTGITVHLPLPEGIDPFRILRCIAPFKDVEGTHPHNLGMLSYGYHDPSPCAARAAVEILKSVRPDLAGLEVVIVGHSELVGKPIGLLLLQSRRGAATPTICHIATRDLAAHTRRADVLFAAAGKAELIHGDMIKPGAVVIDIGVNSVPQLDAAGKPVVDAKGKPKRRLVGDVHHDEAAKIASHLTPVPGGVGPVTMAVLLQNIVACAKIQAGA